MSTLAQAAAQARADLKLRLRSPATLIACLALLGAAYLWMPHEGNVSSISWKTAAGEVQAPLYDAHYAGAAASIVGGIFALLVAFYLVSGSVRRDRDSGVGALLAASPLSSSAYLLGRVASNFAYLGALAALILASAFARYLWFGQGPLAIVDLAGLFLLLNVPALAFVAAAAVFFDVTPVLRGRAAPVLWFFGATLLFVAVPVARAQKHPGELPPFDPLGVVTFTALVQQSFGGAEVTELSTGLTFHSKPFRRVPWPGLPLGGELLALRTLSLLWCLPLLVLARGLFDRFDPARVMRPPEKAKALPGAEQSRAPAPPSPHYADLPPAQALPSLLASTLAEARLVWQAASWMRWALLASAVAMAVQPDGKGGPGAFLLLLGLIVSEASARDAQAGTTGLIAAQPGVPRSAALWKAGAIALFCLAAGALPMAAWLVQSPAASVALALGLIFLGVFAAAAGTLTGGGRLFLGSYVFLWYGAASGAPGFDFSGALSSPNLALSAAYALGALLLLAAAVAVERRRSA